MVVIIFYSSSELLSSGDNSGISRVRDKGNQKTTKTVNKLNFNCVSQQFTGNMLTLNVNFELLKHWTGVKTP